MKTQRRISERVFLDTNEILKKNTSGFKQGQNIEQLPLRQFVICGDCGTGFTGYIVKEKNLYYYKCNKISCKCNRSAKSLHSKFSDFLLNYQIKKELIAPLKEHLEYVFEYLTEQMREEKKTQKFKLTQLQSKLDKIEERYAYGELKK